VDTLWYRYIEFNTEHGKKLIGQHCINEVESAGERTTFINGEYVLHSYEEVKKILGSHCSVYVDENLTKKSK